MKKSTQYLIARFIPRAYLLLFTAFLIFNINVQAQQWDTVGTPGFSMGTVAYLGMDIDGNVPYVAYRESADSFKTYVKKFDGTNWIDVGAAGISAGESEYQNIVIHNGTPYVLYQDYTISRRITVKMFNGVSWVNVGTPGLSSGNAHYVKLVFNGSTPYVAFCDWGNQRKVSVMKYDGNDWVLVGNAGFSSGYAYYVDLAFDGSTPYVVYQDFNGTKKATVKMFDGSNWVTVGSADFTPAEAYHLNLAIDNSIPYVAFRNDADSMKTAVMKFNGIGWVLAGSSLSDGGGANHDLIAANNSLFLALRDNTGNKVLQFDGSTWSDISPVGVNARAQNIRVSNGFVYEGFGDIGSQTRVTVIKRELLTNTTKLLRPTLDFEVFPLPAQDVLNIKSDVMFETYQIHDLMGRMLKGGTCHQSISIKDLPAGNYLLVVTAQEGKGIVQFVKN